jgi:hypothetical protein
MANDVVKTERDTAIDVGGREKMNVANGAPRFSRTVLRCSGQHEPGQ